MVERVEELPPKLDTGSLRDVGDLEKRHVYVVLTRSVECISSFVPKSARSARCEGRHVPKTRQLLVEGSAAGKHRVAPNVYSLRARASQNCIRSRNYGQRITAQVPVNSIETPAVRERAGRAVSPRTGNLGQNGRDEIVPMIKVGRPVVASHVG